MHRLGRCKFHCEIGSTVRFTVSLFAPIQALKSIRAVKLELGKWWR